MTLQSKTCPNPGFNIFSSQSIINCDSSHVNKLPQNTNDFSPSLKTPLNFGMVDRSTMGEKKHSKPHGVNSLACDDARALVSAPIVVLVHTWCQRKKFKKATGVTNPWALMWGSPPQSSNESEGYECIYPSLESLGWFMISVLSHDNPGNLASDWDIFLAGKKTRGQSDHPLRQQSLGYEWYPQETAQSLPG